MSNDDKDRLDRQYRYLSRSEQEEVKSNLVSFTRWLQAIKALADLVPYAVSLFQWIRKKYKS